MKTFNWLKILKKPFKKNFLRKISTSNNLIQKLILKLNAKTSIFTKLESLILRNFCNNKKNKKFTILQIGANDGKICDPLNWIIKNTNCNAFLIEPVPIYFKALKSEYSKFNNVECINKCITDKTGKVFMHIVNPGSEIFNWQKGIASLDANHYKRSKTNKKLIKKIEVDSINFTDLINSFNIKNIDVLVIDCEGYDIELIKLFPFNIFTPKIIMIEFDLDRVYSPEQGCEAFDFLLKNGYKYFHKDSDDLIAYK